jgi:UDP-N-acetylenolpyruvoylglucosamine reductase
MDHVRLFDNQPLVLVTEEGATEKEVSALADAVAEKVFNATGIKIEREVRSLA